MSNSRGIYVGAVLQCEVEKVSETSRGKFCPVHGAAYGDYCSVCGTKTDYITTTEYPTGYSMLDDNEAMRLLPSEREWRNGVLYFCSNLSSIVEITSVDSEFLDEPTCITPEFIQGQLTNLAIRHAEDIAKISTKCKNYKVVWAVVPWWEF